MNDFEEELKERRKRDWGYESGRVFSSMCSTPLEEAWKAYKMYKDTNALDRDIFPSIENLEKEAIKKMGELFSHPEAGGYIGSGGTEGNLVGLWLARKKFGGNKVIAPKSAHYSVEKACDIQQLELVRTKMTENYEADVVEMKENLDQDTCAVVATVGTTALGMIDPVEEISEVVKDYECSLHIDASSGGFILPFLENTPNWDFTVNNVTSITTDPDKMGLVPIPAGIFLVRRSEWLNEILIDAPYLRDVQPTLLGTRPGGSVAAVWASLEEIGFDSYQKLITNCLDLTSKLADGIKKIHDLELVVDPELNVVSFNSDVLSPPQIYEDLKERNWLVSLNTEPESIRLVVMPHHDAEHIKYFLEDLEEYMEEVN